ncbi:NAD(P)-binding protein [Gonapodya prolifera JEL478]|uniref:NAD(P)-binding protein n=1 Tax=Gonapodya prolifera (strain JEL478) TaxID=1344416 RepID=A0A139AL47_GONPJ|nr:NAD(P)-binding protein [Gonapodya prolifera JEL478]|eukprot:KXS17517.1 NAD(P)-binding protein [Gonapodya prolifera JEL478]
MSSQKPVVLVFGATGKQGGACVDALLAKNQYAVRAVTRNPGSPAAQKLASRGVEVVKGDMNDGSGLKQALQGVWGVFLVTDLVKNEVEQGVTVVDASFAAGVQFIVYASVGGLSTEAGRNVPHFATKLRVEEHIRTKSWPLGYTVLRPTAFMENLVVFTGPLTLGSVSTIVPPGLRGQYVAVSDIGAFAAMALAEPKKFLGKEIELAGDFVSGEDMARVLGDITGVKWKASIAVPTWLLRLLSQDMALMVDFFVSEGCKADIPTLRAMKPDLQDFRAWCKAQGIGNIAKGENRYKFQEPTSWGLYAGVAVGVGVLGIAAAYVVRRGALW